MRLKHASQANSSLPLALKSLGGILLILTVWHVSTASVTTPLPDTSADTEIRAVKAVWPQTISLDGETDQVLTYYIVVENRNTEPVHVQVTDHIPDYTHLSPGSNRILLGTGEFEYDPTAHKLDWNGRLEASDSASTTVVLGFDVLVESDASHAGVIANTAHITCNTVIAYSLIATTTILGPTSTPTPTPTDTPMPVPTATPISQSTDTPTPTDTPMAIPTETPIPPLTDTPTPTVTPMLPPRFVYLPTILKNRHACSDQCEPNDSIGHAFAVEIGETIRANFCADDPDDYYKLVLDRPATIIFRLIRIPGDADLDLYLYDEESGLVDFSNQGSHGDDEEITRPLDAGTYYIRVYPFDIPRDSRTRWYELEVIGQ